MDVFIHLKRLILYSWVQKYKIINEIEWVRLHSEKECVRGEKKNRIVYVEKTPVNQDLRGKLSL
ncbi:MAG: hypothetical protein AUK44_05470 [Porphyromonadaceae bacterium CG2_30_38_12]|nr:MAG: hypothetical protein AUK44_05470 [Porphyromonadaceae bacterium CG2_30_38_12]